ncbi:MAG: flippase-like domain-containing protein [Desulfobacula sp.]|nr:flippase-like domain-containing protein [Desulfobacula sp.]MDA8133996.1 lysylphosphatidylglycerol synthase transmembrane domain-containing protein [Desulfobacteraceae bacterium]
MTQKTAFSLTAGIMVSAVALYLALRRVPFADLSAYLAVIDYGWVLLSGAVAVPCYILRTLRWRIILESRIKLGFWQVFHPLMIGFMLNSILPGRAGEAARPYILAKKENLPFTTGLATVAMERLLDMGFLILLSFAVLTTLDLDPGLTVSFGGYQLSPDLLSGLGKGMIRLCLGLMGGILLILLPLTRSLIQKLILSAPGIIPFASMSLKQRLREKLMQPLADLINLFAAGFSLLKKPGKTIQCLLLTLLIWGGTALSFYVMAKGCPGVDLSYPESVALMVIICLFIALPSAPGYWGVWEAGGVFGLSLFGVEVGIAAGYTLANHFIQLLPVIVMGLISAMATGADILRTPKIRAGERAGTKSDVSPGSGKESL